MNKIVNGVANDYEFPPISAYNSIDLNELTKTMERLKKVPNFDILMKENNKLQQELDQYKNIIKEAREFIKDKGCYEGKQFCDDVNYYELKELLEILDKGAD